MSLLVDIEKKVGGFTLKSRFQAEKGVLGLLGPSGCGKTMTLKCIAGILRPDRGKIVLNGVTLFDSEKGIDLPPQKRKVGFLFQNYALFPNMTVYQNVLCGLYHEKNRQEKQKRVREVLELLHLTEFAQRRPSQLSGGQAQRAALARILVGEPDILLLDEPFSALDSHLREKLQMELRTLLARFGKEVILVTHSREEAFRLCGRLAVMEEGAILVQKDTGDLFRDPEKVGAAVLTGCKNIVPAKRLDAHRVEIPLWGVTMETGKQVPEKLTHIGIRGHSFSPAEHRNRYGVTILDRMEEPFEWSEAFRFEGQNGESLPVWWRHPKQSDQTPFNGMLGVKPEDILLLE